MRKWNPIWRELGPELPRGSTVLDVPCGRGRFTENILGSGLTLVDADLSRPMLERALERAGTDRRVRGAGTSHGDAGSERRTDLCGTRGVTC